VMIYTPATNFSGTDSFTFRVKDAIRYSGYANVTITVTPVNWGLDEINVVETQSAGLMLNDTIVTVDSANEYATYAIDDAHHLNVHSTANAETIAQDSQASGLVDWRAK